MKTPTPEQARDALAAAEAEKTEAEELAAALTEKVRAGDESVQPADLSAARELADFAELRVAAARRKLSAAEDADRHARAEAVAAEARALVEQEDTDDIAAKMRAAVDALADLCATTAARRERIGHIAAKVRQVAADLDRAGLDSAHELPKRYGIAVSYDDSVSVYKPKMLGACPVSPALALAAAVGLAVPDNGKQAEIAEQMTYLSARVEAMLNQVPAVRAVIEGAAA
ncbi:hypothetical protein [Streptomyces sp. NPDC005969]|uniref:hypothetical protein n=1 Tax=Streptomyces sp. NPDC005969 TaxID=3156722 RepID=UPI0033CF94B3